MKITNITGDWIAFTVPADLGVEGRTRYQNEFTGDWYVLQQDGTYRLTDDGKTDSSWCSGPGEWRLG